MGTYLNPGKQSFLMAVNSEIFVDKSEMIRYLNTVINSQQRYISVSRPRRFGKTMAADMICNFTGNVFINSFFASPINAGVLAMVCGLIIVPIVSLLTPKPDKAKVDEMFSCYDRTTVDKAAHSLGE